MITLPDLIFDKIMLMIDLESLQKCRQVCKMWNKKIMRNLWESPRKQWGKIIESRMEKQWICYGTERKYDRIQNFPSDEKMAHALLLGKTRPGVDRVKPNVWYWVTT